MIVNFLIPLACAFTGCALGWAVYRLGRRDGGDTIARNLGLPVWVMRAALRGDVVRMNWTEADERAAAELLDGEGK